MGSQLERDRLGVDVVSSYALRMGRPDGVTQFTIELKPYLEDKGCSVRLIGPYIQDKENNAADYTLGTTIKLSHDRTTLESGVSFNKARARNILLTTRPDALVLQEPLAGHLAHTLISASPKKDDGSLLPTVIGHFHARAESLDRLTRLAFQIAKRMRRPRRKGYGIGLSDGYINTVFKPMNGRIAVSHPTRDFWNNLSPGNYEVIHNGIDTGLLTPEGPKIPQWNDRKKTILFAGRHDPRKGIDDLIRAFARIRQAREDVKLKITGEGQMTKQLHTLVRELQVPDVEFLGILPRTDPSSVIDLVRAYRTADVFVSPAIGGEGFGRTLAEALSCGTLTVGTDIDGYREVIGGKPFARSAKPGDFRDLASKMVEPLDLPEEERIRLERQASEYVEENFSWPIIAQKTVLYYEKCVNSHGRTDWPEKERLPRSGVIFDSTQI